MIYNLMSKHATSTMRAKINDRSIGYVCYLNINDKKII